MPGRRTAPPSLATGRRRAQTTRQAPRRLGRAAAGLGAIGAIGALAVSHLRRVEVRGPSMRPALLEGDRLLCGPPVGLRPGDLVVVEEPGTAGLLVVKRVAGVVPGGLVVLGDNLGASRDSRAYGPVPRSAVRGRPWWRYHPPARVGRLRRRAPAPPPPPAPPAPA